jgi:hypothetical protein
MQKKAYKQKKQIKDRQKKNLYVHMNYTALRKEKDNVYEITNKGII